MITCPECGQQADDNAKFCERCGQGLAANIPHPPPSSISPLEIGTKLKGSYRITALLDQSTLENRYRAERTRDSSLETVKLREQLRPSSGLNVATLGSDDVQCPVEEDPAGPRAKTAELRIPSSSGAPAEVQESTANASDEQQRETGDDIPAEAGIAAEMAAAPEDEPGDAELSNGANDAVQPLTDVLDDPPGAPSLTDDTSDNVSLSSEGEPSHNGQPQPELRDSNATDESDLGEVFGRVLALSTTLNHPAFQRATAGFAERGRVYLVYPDENLCPLSSRPDGLRMDEAEAINVAVQVCQAVSFVHRRGLRVNDICPESVAFGADGRIKLTGLDYISNDNELQNEPIVNDGYTAPEIYRGKKADKRADIFSVGALLYTCVTGERLDSETWREEAGPIHFYPPHVVTPALEQILRRALQFDAGARWPTIEAFKAELVKLAAAIKIRADALTDVGKVREHNEDSVLAFECKRDSLISPAQIYLYVVADGMGGAEAGEVASAIAVETIRNYVDDKLANGGAVDVRTSLQEAIEQANTKIIEHQAAHPETRSMGSTAVAALVNPPEAAIAWVGDSRAYICSDGALRQLSKDHSLVQRLLEIGQITPEEARHHEHKNVITRSLGARPTGPAGAESCSVRLKRGDRLMLCSDGLTTHVEDHQINEILRRHSDPIAAARELVVAANAGGGTDNVSVVVMVVG
jgi:protein phosphatase